MGRRLFCPARFAGRKEADMDGEKRYRFFQHTSCEFFPCHSGVAEADFNCLFCYCPLYALGKRCGGSFTYTARGIKDCSGCAFPHRRDSYDAVIARYGEIMALVKRIDGEAEGE